MNRGEKMGKGGKRGRGMERERLRIGKRKVRGKGEVRHRHTYTPYIPAHPPPASHPLTHTKHPHTLTHVRLSAIDSVEEGRVGNNGWWTLAERVDSGSCHGLFVRIVCDTREK